MRFLGERGMARFGKDRRGLVRGLPLWDEGQRLMLLCCRSLSVTNSVLIQCLRVRRDVLASGLWVTASFPTSTYYRWWHPTSSNHYQLPASRTIFATTTCHHHRCISCYFSHIMMPPCVNLIIPWLPTWWLFLSRVLLLLGLIEHLLNCVPH